MVLWLLAGAVIGVLNAGLRWWTVSRLHVDLAHRAVFLVLAGMTLRLSLVASLLAVGLRQGILPGLLSFGGMCLARWGTVVWFNANGLERLSASTVARGRRSQPVHAPSDD